MFGAVIALAASGFVAESANAQGRVLSIQNATVPFNANAAQTVVVPINLVSQNNESSLSFSITYAAGLTNPTVTLGTGVPAGSNLGTNPNNAGQRQLGILVDSTNTYAAGTRNVVNVTFTVPAGTQLGQYPVTFGSVPTPQSVSSAAGALLATTYTDGFVQVGTSAAGVEIAGRVVTPDGRGIRNATVFIADTTGRRRVATTSSFGYYRFEDVEAGQSYVIGVNSKQYRFTARQIQIVDSLADFDFVGQQ